MSAVWASHRSWQCWVTRSGADPESICVELVWAISGVVPRILICADFCSASGPVDIATPGPNLVDVMLIGPSGHGYDTGDISPWHPLLASTWETWPFARARGMNVTVIGVDADSSEAIARRAFDLLIAVRSVDVDLFDGARLEALLAQRSDVWKSW